MAAHLHAAPVENLADRASVDAEPGTQLVGGGARYVALDQRLDLVGVELLCPPWFRSAVELVWWGRIACVAGFLGLLPGVLWCSKVP